MSAHEKLPWYEPELSDSVLESVEGDAREYGLLEDDGVLYVLHRAC